MHESSRIRKGKCVTYLLADNGRLSTCASREILHGEIALSRENVRGEIVWSREAMRGEIASFGSIHCSELLKNEKRQLRKSHEVMKKKPKGEYA